MARLSKQGLVRVAVDVRRELESFKEQGWDLPADLCGFCMYGSIMVWQALKRLGRRPLLVEGAGHWFTHCDGYLIDVTASQFGEVDVVVRSLNGLELRSGQDYWNVRKTSETIKGIRESFPKYAQEIAKARQVNARKRTTTSKVLEGNAK